MTNDDANFYLELHDNLEKMVESGKITSFSIDPTTKELNLNMVIIPKQTVQYIECDFVITPNGTSFK